MSPSAAQSGLPAPVSLGPSVPRLSSLCPLVPCLWGSWLAGLCFPAVAEARKKQLLYAAWPTPSSVRRKQGLASEISMASWPNS